MAGDANRVCIIPVSYSVGPHRSHTDFHDFFVALLYLWRYAFLMSVTYAKSFMLLSKLLSRLSLPEHFYTSQSMRCIYTATLLIKPRLLGLSAFAGFVVLLIGWPLNSYISRRSIRIQKGVLAARDKRMGVLNELIGAVSEFQINR